VSASLVEDFVRSADSAPLLLGVRSERNGDWHVPQG
jgi:hypothetical protein